MAKRRSIIILDDEERTVLKAAEDGRPVENVLRRLRKQLGEGLKPLEALLKAKELEYPDLVEARRGLINRVQLINQLLPEEEDQDVRATAATPIHAAIELCNQIEQEQFAEQAAAAAGEKSPAGDPTAV